MGTLACIGLGSNLGDRRASLDAAIVALAETPGVEVRAVSRYHETPPVGGPDGQGAFLNAVAALDTTLGPFDLHGRLRQIEADAGRVRTVRWGERTLDLDLLLFGDEVLDTTELTIPHLRMAVRRFVLAPASEVVPDAVDPLTRRTIRDLLANLDRRPSVVALTRSVTSRWTGPEPYAELLRALGAVGQFGSRRSSGGQGVDPSNHPESRRECVWIGPEPPTRGSEPGRWSEGPGADSWIVFGDQIPETAWPAGSSDAPGGSSGDRPWPSEALPRVVRPTFVVLAGEPAEVDLTRWSRTRIREEIGQEIQRSPVPDCGCDAPLLRVRGLEAVPARRSPAPPGYLDEVERIDEWNASLILREVLAACAASRAGGDAVPGTLPTAPGPL